MKLRKFLIRDIDSGCEECDKRWYSANAQALAAKHALDHNHKTYANVVMTWTYEPDTHTPLLPGIDP
jgi:hypothetical protein